MKGQIEETVKRMECEKCLHKEVCKNILLIESLLDRAGLVRLVIVGKPPTFKHYIIECSDFLEQEE